MEADEVAEAITQQTSEPARMRRLSSPIPDAEIAESVAHLVAPAASTMGKNTNIISLIAQIANSGLVLTPAPPPQEVYQAQFALQPPDAAAPVVATSNFPAASNTAHAQPFPAGKFVTLHSLHLLLRPRSSS